MLSGVWLSVVAPAASFGIATLAIRRLLGLLVLAIGIRYGVRALFPE